MTTAVRWADLLPEEFLARQAAMPVVYLPMGMCEPHGHIAAFGLDTHKADYLCDEAARRFGGVVAPTQGYHIHESGIHRSWLKSVAGDVNPRMASLPPDLMIRTLVFQLRAFVNAGFSTVAVISGHNGPQPDLRIGAEEFTASFPDVTVRLHSDPELVTGRYEGDHAGLYEVSQLLAIRPELVDLSRLDRIETSPLGRFAQNPDAGEATAEHGVAILEATLERIGELVAGASDRHVDVPFISVQECEEVWQRVAARADEWVTLDR
ncbi:MAG: creatininase family protein [Actinobacteria bacterium]|nr:creatininase family protein [Actinomycetota bacterium]NIS34383.1 creatininase family protein [Actinomycetota bacterium]NIT97443.1 creatininase family protein [Actinomycetota bacterium]NIU21117.1 creatininase family protein [Actinomycetota bacterium]NIU69159.1 creatininase family protein [Actinomycetota bacterium]